jgi:hypothetical protein
LNSDKQTKHFDAVELYAREDGTDKIVDTPLNDGKLNFTTEWRQFFAADYHILMRIPFFLLIC